MARRPGQLTEEDKLKLQNQGLPPDLQDELDIVKARYELASMVEVKSGQSLSAEEVIENIQRHLHTTQNNGGENIYNYAYNNA